LGIACKVFSPVTPLVSTHYNYRDHRKILVIDGRVAFNGGINLADEYINHVERYGHWKDTAVMLTGDAGKSGFITGLYTVLVPILCAVLFRQKTNINMWIGAVFATVGLYLLSVTGGISSVSLGDLLLFIGAFFWAGHIIVIDRMGGTLTSLRFACLQFFICGILSGITALIFEQPTTMDHVMAAAIPLAYCAFMSTGVAYTLQIVGQKFSSNPTLAAIIFSLESVFAALGGMLLLHERMHLQGYIGCLLIFTGIVLSQLKRKEKHT
jgi:drug/metabolite transporter (DMT)-like permease